MPQFAIYFNQQWVGDHPAEWYEPRGPMARAVVAEMKAAGVLVFAGGLFEEIEDAIGIDPTSGSLEFGGPIAPDAQFLGGLTIIDVPNLDEAKVWGGKIAEACGWPQEIRQIK